MTCFIIPHACIQAWKASAPKLILHRVKVGHRGYDSAGNYWGLGAPVYKVESMSLPYWSEHFRAKNRDAAKEFLTKFLKAHDIQPAFFK